MVLIIPYSHIFQDILKFNMPKGKGKGCKKGKALKKPHVEPEQSLHSSDDWEESDHEEDLNTALTTHTTGENPWGALP